MDYKTLSTKYQPKKCKCKTICNSSSNINVYIIYSTYIFEYIVLFEYTNISDISISDYLQFIFT